MGRLRLAVAVLALAACAPSIPRYAPTQEPVGAVVFAPHGFNDEINLGVSLAGRPDVQAQAVAVIDSWCASHELPWCRFYVFHYPLEVPGHGPVFSYRDPWNELIVLSWSVRSDGSVYVGDADWECSHMISKTDDDGNPIR